MHTSRDDSIYTSLDASFLNIQPDILKADVGAKAHFSCQGNALKEFTSDENRRNGNIQLGERHPRKSILLPVLLLHSFVNRNEENVYDMYLLH